ncbi:MAG: PQQ-dependent sugar dehydrogenase [Chloroflexi bacterium]|nr:PQQ-dependent sugar dehydrogenase [Chloroflexota bacterium]
MPSPRTWLLSLLPIGPVILVMLAADCSGGDNPANPAGTPAVVSPTPTPTLAPGETPSPGRQPAAVTLETFATGFKRPTFVTNAGDGSGRIFVVEKSGTIRLIQDGKAASTPFLDISDRVLSTGSEQGLLGLAFHPKFKDNGRFFVTYTARDAANTLAEYRVSAADPSRADPSTARILLAIPDKYPNHNGGMIAFGPGGYLYYGTGDGGGGGDPDGNGQDLNALLGKLLRLDVDSSQSPYGIPASNPLAARAGARPEVWAYGLRNPWRFSFDRQTNDLWVADVGQDLYEEIDFQPAASKGGENYGWNIVEGAHCYEPSSGCDQGGLVLPVLEYGHDAGECSVTGGYVYRGAAYPQLAGVYYFTDYCQGDLRALYRDGATLKSIVVGKTAGFISSFGEDEAGEIYLAGDQDGTIYHLKPAP